MSMETGTPEPTPELSPELLARTRKVIAVHINYPSRAAQRGRTPSVPSYFLKPATSLALDGAELARPQGVELLTVEGEVALVIGARTRNVSPEDAWAHVGPGWAAPCGSLCRWKKEVITSAARGPFGSTNAPLRCPPDQACRQRTCVLGT